MGTNKLTDYEELKLKDPFQNYDEWPDIKIKGRKLDSCCNSEIAIEFRPNFQFGKSVNFWLTNIFKEYERLYRLHYKEWDSPIAILQDRINQYVLLQKDIKRIMDILNLY